MRALLTQGEPDSARYDEQIDRMDEIVRYQLRKPAASDSEKIVLGPVPVGREVRRLADGLAKVYHDKNPTIDMLVADDVVFRGDTGDFLEMVGNLMENACKWCQGQVRVDASTAEDGLRIAVGDDGPGVPAEAADELLQRGTRLDESTPGHGIGLAIVKEIAESYGGTLDVGASDLGGAEFRLTLPTR